MVQGGSSSPLAADDLWSWLPECGKLDIDKVSGIRGKGSVTRHFTIVL